jgi:hypothetical protein
MLRATLSALAVAALAAPATAAATEPTLEARAVLGARTFADGPPSGAGITGNTNGVPVPFPSQPVQGFSAVNRARGGGFWAMPDNGFGAEANSKDFLLRVYRIFPDFETARGGSGTIAVGQFRELRDPDGKIPFPLEREDRLLTGGDIDPESFRIGPNGDLWSGDEFGPWLVHTDATGKVLDAPFPTPDGVRTGENLGASRGFEGMAIAPGGRTLYPMLEGAVTGDPDVSRRIYEFDVARKAFTERRWRYRMERPEHAMGDVAALDRHRLLVIERDNLQGPEAAFKKIHLVDLRRADADGYLVKREVVDLLAIRDPHEISLPARPGDIGLGAAFSFPFQTIESVLPLGRGRLLVLNDNNFPFSTGRNPTRPDDNEAIVIRVPGLR